MSFTKEEDTIFDKNSDYKSLEDFISLGLPVYMFIEALVKDDPKSWIIWNQTKIGEWKLTPKALDYGFGDHNHVMSSIRREKCYDGNLTCSDTIDEGWKPKRIDLNGFTLLYDEAYNSRRYKILEILDSSKEIKERIFWLSTKQKYSQDWNTAEWIEI